MSEPKPARWLPPGAMKLATAGLELGAGLAGLTLLGYWIDRHFGTSPWAVLICATVGIVGGIYNLIRKSVHEMVRSVGQKPRPPDARPGDKVDS